MLQPFEIKSQNSLEAANELLQKAFYNPSVHCSYYSVLQFMLHVLYEELDRDKQADDAQARSQSGGGTHVFTINQIKRWLREKTDRVTIKTFSEDTYHLKRQRVSADYEIKSFGRKEAQKLYTQAQSLIQLLKQNLS